MLEQLLICTRGGLILWSWGNALKGSPIDTLIRSCLLEDRSGAASFTHDSYSLKWTFHNDLGLVFVAVYQRILHLLYVDHLLAAVKRQFTLIHHPTKTLYPDFDETFRQLKIEAEARTEDLKKSSNNNPVAVGHRNQQAAVRRGSGELKNDNEGKKGRKLKNGGSAAVAAANDSNMRKSSVNGKENEGSNAGAFDVNRLQKLKAKGGDVKKKKKVDSVVVSKAEPKKVIKKNRVWDESTPETKLDFTDHVGGGGDDDGDRKVDFLAKEQGESMMDKDEVLSSDSEAEEEDDDDDNMGKIKKPDAKKKGWFSSMFQR